MSNVSEEERKKQRERNEEFLPRLFKLQTQINRGVTEGIHDAGNFMVVLQNFLEKKLIVYRVVINYAQTLTDMIKAGEYDKFDTYDINDRNYGLQGAGQIKVDLVLVHLYKTATTDEILKYMQSQNLDPAKIEHLLAFGFLYPEIQELFPIFALGSAWVDPIDRHSVASYPCLSAYNGLRELRHGGGTWGYSCHFLAILKKSSK